MPDRYPYTSKSQWWTRYWQLGKKIERQGSIPTHHDARVAAILAQVAARWGDARISDACASMEWINGYEDPNRPGKAPGAIGAEAPHSMGAM